MSEFIQCMDNNAKGGVLCISYPGYHMKMIKQDLQICQLLCFQGRLHILFQVDRRNSLISFAMSGGLDVLALKEEDVQKFLVCQTHLGGQNVDFQVCLK